MSHNTKKGNKSFKNVAKFKHLGKALTNQNSAHGKLKSALNSGYCLSPFGPE